MANNVGASAISTNASESSAIVLTSEHEIKNLIYNVRGQQVMLDSDLARLYGVETKVLNQAVSRNPKRFPEQLCFRLSREEVDSLKSQFVTSNGSGRGGRRKLPQVFTEQGISMLSAVLRSDTAIDVSLRIMKSFVEMRHFLANNAAMFEQISAVELRQLEYQKSTDERFERVFDYMQTHDAPNQKLFFEGQVYDAFELLVQLVQRAERKIVLIDNYVDTATLNILAKKSDGVEVTIHTQPNTHLTQTDIDTFNTQYPLLTVRHTRSFHDRYLILDDMEGYFIGASLKDAGKKSFAVTRIEDKATIQSVLERLD